PFSANALRSAEMWTWMLFLDDHPAPYPLHQLVFADDFPPAEASTQRMSSARLPSRTGFSSRRSSRRARSSRNRPNLTSPSTIGLSRLRTIELINQRP